MATTVRRTPAASPAVLAAVLVASVLVDRPALGQARSSPSKPLSSGTSSPTDIKSLEEFLSRALRNHPEILAAEAKVESAQAELTRTRFQITRELITLWNERQFQSQSTQQLEAAWRQGQVGVLDFIEAKGKLTEIEAQVSYLLGRMGGAGTRGPAGAKEAGPKQLPQGPSVEKILTALNSPTELEFIETPIQDVADTLEDYHKVLFVVDPSVAELFMTVNLKAIPLGAALSAAEALTPGIRFVVCDYGILVTSDTSDAAATYISANEFWREQLSLQKPLGATTETETPR